MDNQVNIRPEDEVTITTTYGELARVYAVMGHVNGKDFSKTLWQISKEMLSDTTHDIYDEHLNTKDVYEVIDYSEYQEKWINALFNKKTEQQLQIEALEETIRKAAEQIKKLKGE